MRTVAGCFFVLALIFALPQSGIPADPSADSITGLVVRVIDGDAINVLQDKTTVQVRLEGIDAPEAGQPFGAKARQALASKILAKTINVERKGNDKYGRTLGVVWLDGRNINLEMVAEGWAWHFKKYSKDPVLASTETQSRAKHTGLWADSTPQSPWDWRAAEKERRKQFGVARATTDPSVPALTQSDTATPRVVMKPVQTNTEADDKSVVYIVTHGRHYHSPTCSYLNGSKIAISLSDAKERHLTRCPKCGGHPTHLEDHSSDSAIDFAASDPTPVGKTIFTGPRGGRYHYSASGKKVYERKK
jgi:micrococcal nuclease